MNTKISSSSIRMYTECPKKYSLHYKERLRAKVISGALLFGSAIDQALNTLLKTKNLDEAKDMFERSWALQQINGISTILSTATNVVYADKDFDADLLLPEDNRKFIEEFTEFFSDPAIKPSDIISTLKSAKSDNGFDSLSQEEKQAYAYGHWLCLRRKGHILLKAYQDKVLPQIDEVVSIQEYFSIGNHDGDSLIGYVDLVIKLKNGKTYIMDNKTSTRLYKWDAPMRSQQLILYYHALKEKYSPEGVGFFVLYKTIKKNKTKVCNKCSTDHTGRHQLKKCDVVSNKERCNGEFTETCHPEGEIDSIFNTIPEAAENLVMEMFDKANDGINKEIFTPNLLACGDSDSPYKCPYSDLCWKNSEKYLIKLEKKDEV